MLLRVAAVVAAADAGGDEMGISERGGVRRISPLRRRMIRDMDLAGLTKGTQEAYICAVVDVVRYCEGKSPELITEEEVYRYILWLRDEQGVARGTFQTRFYGLKFLFYRTLNRDWSLFFKNGFVGPGRSDCRGRCLAMSVAA